MNKIKSQYLQNKQFVRKIIENQKIDIAKHKLSIVFNINDEKIINKDCDFNKQIQIIKEILTPDEFFVYETVEIKKQHLYKIQNYSYSQINKLYTSAINKIAEAYRPFNDVIFDKNI